MNDCNVKRPRKSTLLHRYDIEMILDNHKEHAATRERKKWRDVGKLQSNK